MVKTILVEKDGRCGIYVYMIEQRLILSTLEIQ